LVICPPQLGDACKQKKKKNETGKSGIVVSAV
jgi:hypothetical protein